MKDRISSSELFDHMANCLGRGVKEVLGETKGISGHDKETWWWNAEVQQAITEKKRHFEHG